MEKIKMEHVVFKHRRTTLERAEKFISSVNFTDVNLRGRLYPKSIPLKKILHFAAPDRISYGEAVNGDYSSAEVAQAFGPTWSTHWFCLEIEIPADWEGQEVRLIWDSNTEALVWVDGDPVQGLSGGDMFSRHDFILSRKLNKEQLNQTVYVEMACNCLFGEGLDESINPADPNKTFTLSKAAISVFDRDVYDLLLDIQILYEIAKEIPENNERSYQALYTVNEVINECEVGNKSSYHRAREIAATFFNQKNGDSQHVVHAMGHAHIDTAWMWPYAEAIRKCARSWSCAIRLMEHYPWFIFTCSQVQQYDWVKQNYPTLYKKICHFVKTGQFVPVGGTWVEMDGNIPSGEAFIRQFLYGQQFYKKEFGIRCSEFWLPDTFGYSAQLPQIMRICAMTRFLTQKLSWNLVNKFPHHTFQWAGIDGSKILSHFPPGDNYNMEVKIQELLYTVQNFRDKGRSGRTCYLFGYGDGGNGPTEEMLEKLQRLKDVDGLPRVKPSSPDEYFSAVEKESEKSLCTWHGELYLEMHNGTYTTQAKVKKANRKGEFLLHDAELLASIATVQAKTNQSGYKYPAAELLRIWKLFLLNQFHDVLPGSSINVVYKDAHRYYNDVEKSGNNLVDGALAAILKNKQSESTEDEKPSSQVIVNTQSWPRSEVIKLRSGEAGSLQNRRMEETDMSTQIDSRGNTLVAVSVSGCSVSCIKPMKVKHPVSASKKDDVIYLENEHLSASLDQCGRLLSLKVTDCSRSAVSVDFPGNQFVMFDDIPLYWDAWDVMHYHLETRKPLQTVLNPAVIIDNGPLRAAVEVSLKISDKSHLKQIIILDAGSPQLRFQTQVTWQENRKFLKVEFPTSIHTTEATYEIQYGHLRRPNHYNTSWDSARYEVCGHKWADLSEFGFGVALLNDCKYGYSAVDGVFRLSLLRAPKAPDEEADMGTHEFTYAVMPHRGTLQEAGVICEAYNLNSPLQLHMTPDSILPNADTGAFFSVNTPQVILETVKIAEDNGDAMVLRLYEAFGGSTTATLTTSLSIKTVRRCNGLEDPFDDTAESVMFKEGSPSTVQINFTPFQIVSLLVGF